MYIFIHTDLGKSPEKENHRVPVCGWNSTMSNHGLATGGVVVFKSTVCEAQEPPETERAHLKGTISQAQHKCSLNKALAIREEK